MATINATGLLRAFVRAPRMAALTLAMLAAPVHNPSAQAASEIPVFAPCRHGTAPTLPQRWRAVGLMFPFLREQLEVGEFIYDAAVPAMRATLVGLEYGAVDLLITANETYQLGGPHDAPDTCTALGHKYVPPTRQWLPSAATCDGEAALAGKKVEWWKTATADGRTNWQWYASDTRLPWRLVWGTQSSDPAVVGDYGMTYFPTFTPIVETKLAQLRDFCAAKTQRASGAEALAATARDLMTLTADIGEAERARRIAALIPGLNRNACAAAKAPSWPQNFVMTAILSPVQHKYTPLPSLLFYDWQNTATLFAYMYDTHPKPGLEIISVLQKDVGYSVERLPNGRYVCAAKAPGVLRPDWMANAGCECKGAIDRNPQLGPEEISYIRACPIKAEGLRAIWSWYTDNGRPILFVEPAATSRGLNIADYHQWSPGAKMPPETFAVPEICTRAAEAGLPPVGHGLAGAAAFSCSDCHVTRP
jgi:hypothetical protein